MRLAIDLLDSRVSIKLRLQGFHFEHPSIERRNEVCYRIRQQTLPLLRGLLPMLACLKNALEMLLRGNLLGAL